MKRSSLNAARMTRRTRSFAVETSSEGEFESSRSAAGASSSASMEASSSSNSAAGITNQGITLVS